MELNTVNANVQYFISYSFLNLYTKKEKKKDKKNEIWNEDTTILYSCLANSNCIFARNKCHRLRNKLCSFKYTLINSRICVRKTSPALIFCTHLPQIANRVKRNVCDGNIKLLPVPFYGLFQISYRAYVDYVEKDI